MDTEHLEKQLSTWNKLMYMALGAAIAGSVTTVVATLALSGPDHLSPAYIGLAWLLVPIAVTPPGFFMLFGRRWKLLPLSRERLNTISGYLFASWLSLSVPLLLGAGDEYNFVFLGYTAFLGLLYWRVREKFAKPEETFP